MATPEYHPEAEALEVVLLGSFNPAIFHPEWFGCRKIIAEEDVQVAKLNAMSREVADVELGGIRLVCINDRLSLMVTNVSQAPRLQDVLLNILALLSHLPITACGINPSAHFRVADTDYWHKIGHRLAPKEPVWNSLVKQAGMRSLLIEGLREGSFPGRTHLWVEPSASFNPGIFTRANYDYTVAKDKIHTEAAAIVSEFVKSEWTTAAALAKLVAEKIFSTIHRTDA